MVEVMAAKLADIGISDRCVTHIGYIDSFSSDFAFDAATSILVSQFILDNDVRTDFYAKIRSLLKPKAKLINADLSVVSGSPEYRVLIPIWLKVLISMGIKPEDVHESFSQIEKNVAISAPQVIENILLSAGFKLPTKIFQTILINAWISEA